MAKAFEKIFILRKHIIEHSDQAQVFYGEFKTLNHKQ